MIRCGFWMARSRSYEEDEFEEDKSGNRDFLGGLKAIKARDNTAPKVSEVQVMERR